MKNSQIPFLLTCLCLLCCIPLVTACFDYNKKKSEVPVVLAGKWQLQRIEDPFKTEVPPTNVIKVELEFDKLKQTGSNAVEKSEISGNMLSGKFTGTAVYTKGKTAGALDVGPLTVTDDILFARYHQFDEHYLQELASATHFCIINDNLVIEAKDGTALIYTWSGGN